MFINMAHINCNVECYGCERNFNIQLPIKFEPRTHSLEAEVFFLSKILEKASLTKVCHYDGEAWYCEECISKQE